LGTLARRFEQKADEGDRLVARVGDLRIAAESKQLFELIDQHQQVFVAWDARLLQRVGQAARAAAQRRFQHDWRGRGKFVVRRRAAAKDVARRQRLRKIADRILTRPQHCDAPR
jgi:hypothetical protein